MMFSYGSMIGYFAILDQCLKHLGYEYPDKVTSFTILSIMSSGIVSTLFFSYCIKRTLKYKMIISICKSFLI